MQLIERLVYIMDAEYVIEFALERFAKVLSATPDQKQLEKLQELVSNSFGYEDAFTIQELELLLYTLRETAELPASKLFEESIDSARGLVEKLTKAFRLALAPQFPALKK